MRIKTLTILAVALLYVGTSFAQTPTCAKKLSEQKADPVPEKQLSPSPANPKDPAAPAMTDLKAILESLSAQTKKLTSYQARLDYLLIQDPDLLDARTLQIGNIYYQKTKSTSNIRISFLTRQLDDAKLQDYRQEFLFDGAWLTRVDYQNREVDQAQQAPEAKPIEVFEFIGIHFPLIGFAKIDQLEKDFEMSYIKPETDDPNEPVHLKLKVKKDSKYKDTYTQINFWIDRATSLPARLKTISTEEDIYEFRFLDAKINKKIENSVFNLEWPADFGKNRVPLKENANSN